MVAALNCSTRQSNLLHLPALMRTARRSFYHHGSTVFKCEYEYDSYRLLIFLVMYFPIFNLPKPCIKLR